MKNDFILTQRKEVIMTSDKTITVIDEKLETKDLFGKKQLLNSSHFENIDYHDDFELRGAV